MTNSQNSHHKNCITDTNIRRITNEILGLKGLGRVQPTFTNSKRYSVRINQFGIGRTLKNKKKGYVMHATCAVKHLLEEKTGSFCKTIVRYSSSKLNGNFFSTIAIIFL